MLVDRVYENALHAPKIHNLYCEAGPVVRRSGLRSTAVLFILVLYTVWTAFGCASGQEDYASQEASAKSEQTDKASQAEKAKEPEQQGVEPEKTPEPERESLPR